MRSKVRKAQTGRWGGCFAYGFVLVFAAAGCGMFYFLTFRPLSRLLAARSWIAVPCTVLTSRVAESQSDDGTTYAVDVTYSYEVAGRTYQGSRYDFSVGYSSGYDGKARVVQAHPPGLATTCYVDPGRPEESVIDRSPGWYLLFGLFPLPFMAVGIGGLFFLLRSRQRGRADPGRPPVIHGSRPAHAAAPAPGPGGSLVLESKRSPVGKLVGSILVAAFWNGIVSVFVFQAVIPGFRSGDVDWFMTIFIGVFVLVGLVLLASVPYFFLALFNPRPVLRLDHGYLTPGATSAVAWSFTGNAGRLRKLTLELEGREAATYRRGTSSTTDHHTFFLRTLAAEEHPGRIARGLATLEIPSRTMPSFESSNNKIEWRIKLQADIPLWPDVDEEFPLTVHPPAPESAF